MCLEFVVFLCLKIQIRLMFIHIFLQSIFVDNPAAKILIDISKTQDEEVGDGTTTVAVLAGELLREAEKLVSQKIHP